MLRSVEIRAVLTGLEKEHRSALHWDGSLEISLDCFVCERLGRTTRLTWGAERAVCSGDRREPHYTAARISAFDTTRGMDTLAVRAVVDHWFAPFQDAKYGSGRPPTGSWVRLGYKCGCPHRDAEDRASGSDASGPGGSVQSNEVRPRGVRCPGCEAEIAVSAEAPTVRLLG